MKPSQMSDPEIFKRLDAITKQLESVIIRLDVTINLMFDLLSNERRTGRLA
jgi:hypothetical protein